MGRQADHTVTLSAGQRVGYSLTERPGGFRVRFVDPTGKRVERATGCDKKGEARQAAEVIITSAYAPLDERQQDATWDEALAHLDAVPDLRADSIKAYRTAVDSLRRLYPDLAGPAAVNAAVAARFPAKCATTVYKRGKASDAAAYKRSPTSVNNRLRHLRSLWKKHWKPAGLVTANPWADVPMLNAPRGKRVRVPDPGAVRAFYDWLAARYPGWELPRLFVFVKALAGCRTRDLCHARTADLTATSLTLAASATKTRQARTLKLPADVLADLRRLAGPVFVWERAAVDLRTHRPAKFDPHADGFNPESWKHTVENLFREFNENRPKAERVRPHDLRARAMTAAAKLYGSVDKVARVMGCDVQTARHYIDGLAFEAEDDTARLHDALRV